MKIHNPEITGSLIFPRTDGSRAVIQLDGSGNLVTDNQNSGGVSTGTKPASDFSGSFTGSFIGDGSNLTGIAATTFNIDALGALGGATIAQGDNFLLSDAGTEKKVTFSNLEDSIFGNVSGDITIAAGGVSSIGTGTIVNADINNSAAIAFSKINSNSTGIISGSSQVVLNDANKTGFDTNDVSEGTDNLYYTDARAQAVSINNVVEDTTPQLGGNLDAQSFNITTTGKILYSNVYSSEGDLPSASTYHGMFAHVHGTGKGYFAHGGNWIKLIDESSSSTTNLSEGTNLYFTNARARGAISVSGDLSYDSGTGVISFTNDSGDIESVTAGNGLTGGGTSGALTVNVGSGDGISVTADAVAVDNTVLRTEGQGIVSQSAQITLSSTTGFNSNEHFTQAQITTLGTVTTGNVNAILPDGVVSGSSQISGVTNAQLAGSIANSKLSNSSVSFGGVSVSLGGSDATPAFDLSDSTGYATSNLSGTITNAQLAGSITAAKLAGSIGNSKLSNSSVSYGGVSVSLGSSDDTPAFNLSDASGYVGDSSLTTLGTVTSGNVTAILPSGVISSSAQVQGDFLEINGDSVISSSAQVSHDSTTGFVANEHINHTSVSITAGTGLTGGGTIASNRTINVVGGDGITANANDIEVDNTVLRTEGQGVVSGSSQVSHDSTTGFVANEHINHSTVSITAGAGLTGGGTIASSRTINVVGGDGITANANDIQVDGTVLRTTGDGVVSGSAQINGQSVQSPAAIYDNSGTPTLRSGITQAEVRTAIGVDAAGTDNSTDVTLANTNYLSLSGQQLTGGTVPIGSGGTGATSAGAARTALGVDAAGTDNSTDVSLVGSYDYITISGQVITRNQITNADLAGSITNGKLVNSGIGIGNGGTIDLGDSVSVADILKGSGVISGSSQVSLSGFDTDDLSEGSSNKYASTTNVKSALNANLGTLTLGDSNDTVSIPGNLTVTGTTTTNNVETVSTSNGVIFEGSVADANELTLLAGTVSADRTVTLPDATGTVALTSDIPTNNNQLTNGANYISSFDITTQTDSKYLRSNANDTATGVISITNSTASTSKTTGALKVTGGVGIQGALNVGGDVVAFASSDERLKDNIELISNPIEKVQSLKGVTWNWNQNADELQQSLPNVGVIAQDVEKVLPQLVTDRDNGFKGVDYAKLTGLLIEAIKDQQKQIDELKSKLS